MRTLLGTHWMVACALALGACAMDDTPVDNASTDKIPTDKTAAVDNSTASASTPVEASADTPSDVTVPEELSFENLPDVAASGDVGPGDSCHVRITSCGKKHHNYPRYCYYGKCKQDPKYQARKECYDSCGLHADCDKLKSTGKCHGHDIDDGEGLAPATSQI
jgi:hypothetical protein